MKQIYEIFVLLGLVYLAYFIFSSITGDVTLSTLIFKGMDIFGPGVITAGMSAVLIAFVILSFGNITWIPLLAREKRIGALSLHVIGTIFALVVIAIFVQSFFAL